MPTASDAEIKAAYRALASRYHPDKHRDNALSDLAKEKLAEINAAYTVLKNPDLRAAYDRERLFAGSRPGASGSVPTPSTPDPASMIRSLVRLIAVLFIVFFALRFIRSPRALLVIGATILIAWFFPRIFRKFKGGR